MNEQPSSSGFKLFSGAILFACANLHPGVPARAQEALKSLQDLAGGGIYASGPVLTLDTTGDDARKPPPMIRTDKPKAVKAPLSSGSGKLLAKLDLAALHNNLWRTSLVADLGGRKFWVSGQQSRQGNLHLVLTDQKSGRSIFMRDTDLIIGHYDLKIGARSYEVTLKAKFTDIWGSTFQISEGSNVIAAFPIRDVMKAMYESGTQATLDGKTVRIHYTDQLFENGDGRVDHASDPLLVLMVEQAQGSFSSEKDRFQGDAVVASDIPHDAYLRAPFKIAPHGVFTLDLKMTDDKRQSLEIYSPGELMALILVADDDAAIADLIKRALEARGHQVEVVSDGLELTEKAQNARPALIVCDIHMPNVYGTGAYEVLQRNPLTAAIPVIFVTGIPPEKAEKIIPKSPKVRLLHKPFDADQLEAAIKELLPAK